VQITTGYNSTQDALSFAPAFGISSSFNSGTGTLTLSGTSSVANYQAALRSVKYTNTSEDPTTASRTVVFQVTDGTDPSNTISSTIHVTAVNDAPTALAFSGLPAQAGIPITYPTGKLGGTDVEAGTTITIDTAPINLVNGTVTLNANGSFTFTPTPQSAGGTASFQYRVSDNGNPAPGVNSAYVTVSFNVAGPAIYFVKAAGTGNCTLGNECTLTTALAFGAASANIFISDAATHSNGPIALNTGGSIIGQGIVAPNFDAVFGIVAPAQGTLAPRPAVNQARPTISNSPITLGTNSRAAGFNTSNNSGDTLIASSKSGLLVKDMDIATTAGSGTFAVHFTNSSGTFTFGPISVTGGAGGSGVNFSGTTSGSTVAFGNVSTTSGDAVTVGTSGATSFSFNDVTSTTGRAINVNTASGAFTFHAINANGGASGILVQNASGSFTVNGTGTTAGSGGTIQNTTGNGAEFQTASSVTLKNMNFVNTASTQTVSGVTCGGDLVTSDNLACRAAIYLRNTTSTSFDRILVDGTAQIGINGNAVNGFSLTNSEVRNAGNESFEAGLLFQNLNGTITLTNANIHNNAGRQFYAENLSGAATIGVSGSTFSNSVSPAGGQGILLDYLNASSATINIQSSTFANNDSGLANALQVNGNNTANLNLTVNGSTFQNNAAGVIAQMTGGANLTYDISNNPVFTGNALQAIIIGQGSPSTGLVSGKIQNNVIGTTGVLGSACQVSSPSCDGIDLNVNGNGTLAATITGNDIRELGGFGIRGLSNGAAILQTKIANNTIAEPLVSSNGNAVFVQSGSTSTATTQVCADIVSNTILGLWDTGGSLTSIRVRNRFAGTAFRLPGYAGAGNDTTAVALFLSTQNGGATASATVGGGDVFTGGAACTTP
jgi:hypothetical protein